MIVNEIQPDTIPAWKAEYLCKEHTNVVLEKIITRIEQVRDKDKLCEYPYNRCINIVKEVLDEDNS